MIISIEPSYILILYLLIAIGSGISSIQHTKGARTEEPKLTNVFGSVMFGTLWPIYLLVNICQRIFDFK